MMTNAEPLVSVCLPTYSRVEKLRRAVGTLLAATYQNLEIIISDNASPDGTEAFCRELAGRDSRIRYIRHPENIGATRNFEFVRGCVNGKYFIWHSDDDYLDPDCIGRCVRELERDESLALVSPLGAYHRDTGTLSHYGNVIQPGSSDPVTRAATYLWSVADNSIFCGFYRVSSTRDAQVPNCLAGDWVWVMDVLLRGRAMVLTDVFVHREYETSTSSSFKNIVRVLGVPAWQAYFPLLAAAVNLVRNINAVSRNLGFALERRVKLILTIALVMQYRMARTFVGRILRKLGLRRDVRKLHGSADGTGSARE